MPWNTTDNKGLQSQSVKSTLGLGAPVALNPGLVGRPYRDGWDIERAYREGMQRVTWVFRCIDAIAGNQARLPAVLRRDNSPQGEIVETNKELLSLLNTKTNDGENSFVFRFRVSAQLLMSTRGVFIEKVRGRGGKLVALHLLPPQHTAPIPDPRKFVSGFEVTLPGGGKKIIRPEDVLWIRRPHPLDPYLSLTPMETAGIAIEIENLAKLYNRNFLYNDGRPGGLLVVRGEMEEDDKEELRSRFRGNLNRAGQTSVIAADDGVDFVDTSATPRDAAYMEMRNITKEEILAAFGVPESIIGNASGRTFANAAEEGRVFWNETMMPHLEVLGRSFDELDEKYYIDFDTSSVPILILAKQERERYLMDEFSNGLISGNEYREGTGRENVKSELMDSLLANPNLTPIGNTEKEFNPQAQQPVDTAAPGAGPPQMEMPQGSPPAEPTAQEQGLETPQEPAPQEEASLYAPIEFKSLDSKNAFVEWETKSAEAVERWTQIFDRSLERLLERQQRVVMEKAAGAKARKAIQNNDLSISSIFDAAVWDKQMREDLRPVLAAIVLDASELAKDVSEKAVVVVPSAEADVAEFLDAQIERLRKVNQTTKNEIAAAILAASALDEREDRVGFVRTGLSATFANLLGSRRVAISEHESQTAYNAGTFFAAKRAGEGRKIWLSRADAKVRSAHKTLHGKSVGIDDSFSTAGESLRFPGDPMAPPSLTMNCRCRLAYL